MLMINIPNITIFHKDDEHIFHKQEFHHGSEFDLNTKKFIKKELNLKDNELIAVLVSGYTDRDVQKIVNFINDKEIKKVYFFIEDVFRIEHPADKISDDLYILTKDPNRSSAVEIEIILSIVKKTNIEFQIFHCEDNSEIFEKKYNIKIYYFDWFLAKQKDFLFTDAFPDINLTTTGKYWMQFNNFIDYKICSFALRPTLYRYYMSALLCQKSETFITWHGLIKDDVLYSDRFAYTEFSDQIKHKIEQGINILNSKKFFINDENENTIIDGLYQYKNFIQIQKSFLQIVLETRFCSPMPNFSEKTLKSIMMFRPFIIMAPPNTLKLLKTLGFKTFNKWWDESYDEITNHHKRFEAVYTIAENILSKDKDDLKNILNEMKPILNYNRVKLFTLRDEMWKYYKTTFLQKS